MALLLGTRDGVWHTDGPRFERAERVCDAGKVYGLARAGTGWLAAAESGLWYGQPEATEWEYLDVPRTPVTATVATSDGNRLFAGTRPAHLYTSEDGGVSWTEVDGFTELPSREQWWNPDVTPHVRALATHPATPSRVVAGVDGGGVHVSDDRGETWAERCTSISGFVHDLCMLGPDEWVAATDAGLFRTRNAGEWWDYLYGDEMAHRYFRGIGADGTVIYAGGARSHPPVWNGENGADAALYRLDLSERAPIVEQEPYPGESEEVALSGTVTPVGPVVGTNNGHVLFRTDDGWKRTGEIEGQPQIRSVEQF